MLLDHRDIIDLFPFFNRKIKYYLISYWSHLQIVSQKRKDMKKRRKNLNLSVIG